MQLLNAFKQEHIIEVLKNTFRYGDKTKILLSGEKCNVNENFILLNVVVDGIEENYVLIKLSENLEMTENQPLESPKLIYPVFIIEDNNKHTYGAFKTVEVQNYVTPKKNDTEYLKIILENLAEHQALELANGKENEIKKPSEYNLKKITDVVTSSDFFRHLEQPLVNETIETLQLDLNKLFDGSNLLVISIANPLANNVCVNLDNKRSIFLNVFSKTVVPPVYDALIYIFKLSNEKFRQEHFANLTFYYFKSLKKYLQKLQSSATDKITTRYEERQVRVLLPVIKFNIIISLLKLETSQELNETLSNIRYFLKYPYINQEDIYEVVYNKFESTDYELLDYNLRSLNAKNGHLGEYFHLDIKVKVQEKESEIQLFAKLLKPALAFQEELLERGPAKKEDFFYRLLLPLCKKYGLESLLDFAPNCYLSRLNWLLVLDDLTQQGYVAVKPNFLLNYEGLRASVESLAKFHACSIILEEMISNELGKTVRFDDNYEEFFQEVTLIYEDGHPMKHHYDSVLKIFYHIAEKCPEILKKLNLTSEEVRERIKEVFLTLFSKIKKTNLIRNVINHGDMYVANMLFKFDEDKLITSGILIDFQMLRYTSPNHDLLFFLYLNSTKETRDKYMEVLLEDYYRYLTNNLRKFNIDQEEVFPKDIFDENVKFMKSAGVVVALNYANLMQVDPDFREEMTHDQKKMHYYLGQHKDELIDLFWDTEQYKNVLQGLVEDMVDLIKSDSHYSP